MTTKKAIRKQADDLIDKYNLQVPVNVENLCSLLGINVEFEPMEDSVSGIIAFGKNKSAIAVNQNQSERRQRFTLAHEIGHYILHMQPGISFIDQATLPVFKRKYRQLQSQPAEDADLTTREEVEANTFAAELLMPYKEVKSLAGHYDNIFDDEAILEMANHFDVSMQAMTIRLKSLGLIPDWAIL